MLFSHSSWEGLTKIRKLKMVVHTTTAVCTRMDKIHVQQQALGLGGIERRPAYQRGDCSRTTLQELHDANRSTKIGKTRTPGGK